MRVFISDLGSSLGSELARNCQDAGLEVLGTAARGGRSELGSLKRSLQSHPSSDRVSAVAEPVALQSDAPAWRRLVHRADVVVITSLSAEPTLALETLKAFEKRPPAASDEPEDVDADADAVPRVRRFLAVSSVLSWSKNAAFAASGDGAGHVEDDFKTRRPARKYAELKTAETQILSAHRAGELETCVLGAGLLYGGAQSQLQLVFREAWLHPERALLVPSAGAGAGGGRNLLPMVSLFDLALLLLRVAAAPSLPKRYLLAVDRASASTTLLDVCRGVSALLGSGLVRERERDEEDEQADALLLDEDDALVAPLQLHLRFDTSAAAMHALVAPDEWRHYERGLLGHLRFFVDDFLRAMDLRPLRLVVLGGPRAGKTQLSRELAARYFLPYLAPDSLLQELFSSAHDASVTAARGDDGDAPQPHKSEDEDGPQDARAPDGDDDDVAAVARPVDAHGQQLAATRQLRLDLQQYAPSAGPGEDQDPRQPLPESALVALLRWKLRGASCRNQGYVLDGLPLSAAQAALLFARDDADDADDGQATADAPADAEAQLEAADAGEGAGEASDAPAARDARDASPAMDVEALLTRLQPRRHVQPPNRVVVLQPPRHLLEARAQSLSEREAEASDNTQAAFSTRLEAFEADVDALTAFFERPSDAADGLEVLELVLQDEQAFRDAATFADPIQRYMEQGGRAPRNFHPTRAELRDQQRLAEQQAREAEARAAQRAREQDAQDEALERARVAREHARLELLQREEAELLETRAKPLRAYLMDSVLPALTEGMLEVVKVQPADPIDYLSEFLFRKGRELEARSDATEDAKEDA